MDKKGGPEEKRESCGKGERATRKKTQRGSEEIQIERLTRGNKERGRPKKERAEERET